MSSNLKRIPSLDGLRAIAIVLVLIFHASGTDGFPHWLYLSSSYGTLGVRIFFVISGFLITSLLLREREKTGTISLIDFYGRRSYRILPAAYVYILVFAIFARHLAGWQDYLLLFFFRRRVGIVLFAMALAPLVRGYAYYANQRYLLGWFPALQDGLATGCLMALLGTRLDPVRRLVDRLILPIVAITLALPGLPYLHGVQPVVSLTLTYIGVALCASITASGILIASSTTLRWSGWGASATACICGRSRFFSCTRPTPGGPGSRSISSWPSPAHA